MVLTLYTFDSSPAVTTVLLTAKALGITMECVPVDLVEREHFAPEYLKLNPQHTVPTLVDGDVVIWDSHAINIYLITKYGKEDDPLYPKDPHKRAIIDQRLHFDSGVLFATLRMTVLPIFKGMKKTIPQEAKDQMIEGYDFLNTFLEGQTWVAGDNLTLADLHLIPTVTSLDIITPIDSEKYPNVVAWIKVMQKLPYYDENRKSLAACDKVLHQIMNS